MILVKVLRLSWTDRGQCTATVDVAGNRRCSRIAANLNQRRTGDRARRAVQIGICAISVSPDTRAGAEDVAATGCALISSLAGNVALEDPHFSAVAHMAVLTATIDRTHDGGPGAAGGPVSCRAADIDDGLVDIAQEEVGHISVAG